MRKRIISVLACGILAMGATFAGAGVLKSEAEEEHGASVPCSAIQLFDTLTEEKVTNETLGVSGVTFNGYGDTWSVNFNGVFTGNTEIEYAFPAAVTGLWNNVDLFDFVVKQTDGAELFTVRKGIPWLDSQDKWQNTIQLFIGDTAYSAKTNSATPYFSGKQAGTLYIESETEGTAIYYTNDAGAKTLLGKFDGASTYGTGDNAVTLPKIELPEAGYKIELKDAMKKAGVTTINTAPLITKINGAALGGNVPLSGDFGVDFSSAEEVRIGDKYYVNLFGGEELQFSSVLTGAALASGESGAFYLNEQRGSFVYGGSEDLSAEGEHNVSVTFAGKTKNYVVNTILSSQTSAIELFSGDAAAATLNGVQGVLLNGEEKGSWKNALNGVFTGNFSAEYVLSEQNSTGAGIVFSFKNLQGEELFTVKKYQGWFGNPSDDWNNFIAAIVGGKTVKSTDSALPFVNKGTAGELRVNFTERGAVISYLNKSSVLTELVTLENVTLPESGYTVEISNANGVQGWGGSPLIASVNGASLSAGTVETYPAAEVTYEGAAQGDTIYHFKNQLLKSFALNAYKGLSKDKYSSFRMADESPETYEVRGEYDLTRDGDYAICVASGVYRKYFKLHVETAYAIHFDTQGGEPLEDMLYSAYVSAGNLPVPVRLNWKFGGWYRGDTLVTEIAEGTLENITLTAHWYDDVKPVLIFADGVFASDTLEYSESGTALSFAKTDVIAADACDGKLSENSITISVKAPGGEFVSAESFVFDKAKFGEYIVRYTAEDASGNEDYIDRFVSYIKPKIILKVNGEIVNSAYEGERISLPAASATMAGSAVQVKISVSLNGEMIDYRGGELTFTGSGVYVVVYFASDGVEGAEDFRTAIAKFEIIVSEDAEAPVLSGNFDIAEIVLGNELKLPVFTATDGVDGNVSVSVTVKYQGETVATGDFKPEKEGVYVVIYTATDKAGNSAVEKFTVVVKEAKSADGEKSGCNKGCGGSLSIGGAGVSLVLIAAACAVCLKKRKN